MPATCLTTDASGTAGQQTQAPPVLQLFEAVRANNSAEVRRLVGEGGVDPNASAGFGYMPPLHAAAAIGHVEVTEALLDLGVDPNNTNYRSKTPLHVAAECLSPGAGEVAALLLRRGADVAAVASSGWTSLGQPLHCVAASCGGEKDLAGAAMVGVLTAAGGDAMASRAPAGETALHIAARAGGVATVGALLASAAAAASGSRAAAVNAVTSTGATPLHAAARNSEAAGVVELLIAQGADVNALCAEMGTPLHVAAGNAQGEEIARMLLAAGARVDIPMAEGGWLPIHLAVNGARSGATAMVSLLLSSPHVSAADRERQLRAKPLLLHVAARCKGTAAAVAVLIDAGLEVDAVEAEGRTALSLAAQFSDRPVVEALLKRGADPNHETTVAEAPGQQQQQQRPPLCYAIGCCNVENAAALLAAGANANFRNNNTGESLLHLAAVATLNAAMIELLLRHGANCGATNADGKTPLELATELGHDAVVAVLQQPAAH